MKFFELPLKGAYLVELDCYEDGRGFFARSFCSGEFMSNGLNPKVVQCNISFNHRRGTLRGMHYQLHPYEEEKLIRCTAGSVYDVILDLRPTSATFKQWHALELKRHAGRMLYVPKGFAHGFQTLEDSSELFYQMSAPYRPECARGVRWNDPAFRIDWPIRPPLVSPRDAGFEDFQA